MERCPELLAAALGARRWDPAVDTYVRNVKNRPRARGILSARYHNLFFDRTTPQSEVKLRVLKAYLEPWASKLGSASNGGTIWVIDGFAGRGRYKTGEAGSPEVAMQLSTSLAARGAAFRLQCIFGETRTENVLRLRELVGKYPAASPMLIEDDFWTRVDDVVQLVGAQPALVFIDPFGLSGLRFDRLSVLVQQLRRSDFIINFRSPAAPRLASTFHLQISTAVGTHDWTTSSVSQVFRDNLQQVGRFLKPASLAVRSRLGGALQSELILASRHSDAYELWNDQIIKEVERLDVDNAIGESQATRDRNLEEVLGRLLAWAPVREWRRSEAIAWHAVEYCGDAHTGTIKRAHARAVKLGAWRALNPQAGVEAQRYVRA